VVTDHDALLREAAETIRDSDARYGGPPRRQVARAAVTATTAPASAIEPEWGGAADDPDDRVDAGDDGHHHLAENELDHHKVGEVGREEPWPKTVALAGGPRPIFPVAALPPVVRDQVAAVALAVQVPIDLAAAVALGVLSAAAGHVVAEVKPGWQEPLALFVGAVAESGEGKGPVVKAMSAPLEVLERERIGEAREGVAIGQALFDTLEQRLKQARAAAAKVDAGPVEEAALFDVAAELARTQRPELPRLLADDATPEALVSLLAQHGRIAVISDEGGLIDTIAGRYSDGVANLDGVLKAWSQLPIRVDRKGRDAELVERPVLTLCLAVQPVVVERLAADPVLRGRGLPARFLWFWPHTRLGRRRDDTSPVPPEVSRAWDELVRELSTLPAKPAQPAQPPASRSSAGSAGFAGGWELTIDDAAGKVFRAFRRAIEDRLRPEDGDLYAANGWAGKVPGQVVRIGGLMHLAEHRTAGLSLPIGEQTMRAAVAIGLYLVDHALAAFGLDGPGGPLAPDARRLLAWIVDGDRQVFSHRDAHSALRSKARPTSDDWRPVLELLERLGYLRCRSQEQSRSRPGRPSSSIYDVNPRLLDPETEAEP